MGELKSCPFCGSKEHQELEPDYYELKHKNDCWLVSTGVITNHCIQRITNQGDIEEWNIRPREEELTTEYDRLKEEVVDNLHTMVLRFECDTATIDKLKEALEKVKYNCEIAVDKFPKPAPSVWLINARDILNNAIGISKQALSEIDKGGIE